ncbi:hypothetical protein H0H92_012856, partial [Tricholoma furcatifolium]
APVTLRIGLILQKKRTGAETRRARLSKIIITKADSNLMKMTIPELDDQLDALKEVYGDAEIPKKSGRGRKDGKVKILQEAITRFDLHKGLVQSNAEKDSAPTATSWEEQELEEELEEEYY